METGKRMIDADDAWQIAQRVYSDPVILFCVRTVLENALMEAAREKLPPFKCTVNEPTVDAVEVVHGQWVDKEDYYMETGVSCSICGERYFFETSRTDFEPYNYCPNCGAKMDGGNKDGN